MPRPPTYLRRLLLLRHHISTVPPPLPPPSLISPTTKPYSSPLKPYFLPFPQITRSFSNPTPNPPQNPTNLTAQSLSLGFSHLTLSPTLILQTLNISPDVGRSALEFLNWVSSKTAISDEVCSIFVDYFGRRKDFKTVHDVIVSGKDVVGERTFESAIDRLVRAGRPGQAVSFFESERMETDYGMERNRERLNFVVSKLCENGYANHAEKMVKSLANEFFPDGYLCHVLIKGWCVDGKLEEARRLAREMYRGGFEIGTVGFNAILDCVCRLCRVKDPFRMKGEAESVLVDMDAAGVPRDVETFNVLIGNLCKLRMTEDALGLFFRMGEWGCSPDAKTFVVLTKSLYQAARVGEGDEMIDRMKSAGFGDALDNKVYYGFLKILCGIERVEHALGLFGKMKEDGCEPGVKSYELLIGKLYAHGRSEKAKALYNEAVSNGLDIEAKDYKVDPRFEKKPAVVNKRLTLPEKMALKRKRLRKINLSFVKKPRKGMRMMY